MQQTTIAQTIREQLARSENKINGFNFFAYTGIKNFVMSGENQLLLKFPRNPNKLTHVWITYNRGTDAYDLSFCKNNCNLSVVADFQEIYFDMLGEVIARNMGVLP